VGTAHKPSGGTSHADPDGRPSQFSLQTLLVGVGLGCVLLAVGVYHPGYIYETFIVCVGLYVVHQAYHTRFKHWQAAIIVGIIICIIGAANWLLFGPALQDAIDVNQRLREIRDELQQ
jgi:hypothetical protein